MATPHHNLTRRPQARRLAVILALLTSLLLASEPYLFGWRIRPRGSYFWAVPAANYYDANQYLAFTRLVLDGRWLIGDPFTPEPVTPRLVMPHVYFQAAVGRVLGVDVIGSFQVVRVLWGLMLLCSCWWLGCLLIRSWRPRRLYLLLLCFSGGATWLLERLGWRGLSLETSQPEGNTFFTLGNLPHLSLSAALLTGLFAALVAHERDGRRRWLVLTAAASLLLSWIHPFDYAILVPALGAYALIRWAEQRAFPAAVFRHGLVVAAGALPAAAYLFWITRSDPLYRLLAEDILERQRWPFYAAGLAPLVLPALVLFARRDLLSRYALPICWVLCVLLLILGPFRMGGKQPRLVGGIHAPLCLLAAVGIDWLPRLLARRPMARGLNTGHIFRRRAALGLAAGLLLLTVPGVLRIWRRHRALVAGRLPYQFQPAEVRGLYSRLAARSGEDDVVLGGTFTGGWTPVLTPARSFWGHWHMTLHEPLRQAQRDWFFAPGGEAAKARWLRRQGIRWVIYWPWEWSDRQRWPHGARDPAAVAGLTPVFVSDEIRLYRLDPETHVTSPENRGTATRW